MKNSDKPTADVSGIHQEETPQVCSYEGSDYQEVFWDSGERRYEDAVEEVALKRLMPKHGRLLLELGAGAGRNTPRYAGWERIVLLDYSRTQLLQARDRLGDSSQYVYVTADIYKLPFVSGLFDGATMIRTLHHLSDANSALANVRRVLGEDAVFILEFANKRNLKAIMRYLLGKQKWSPFTKEQVEFVALNYDFHPKTVRKMLKENQFLLKKQLTVSHFRINALKRRVRHELLVALDSVLQHTGSIIQLSPSVFTKSIVTGHSPKPASDAFFACPICDKSLPEARENQTCPDCGHVWAYEDGIYEFRINPEN
jgi:ubiquinone/menaquinone biosynthesis C-methylase UbiE